MENIDNPGFCWEIKKKKKTISRYRWGRLKKMNDQETRPAVLTKDDGQREL